MQYRRDICQLADTFQAVTAQILRSLIHQTGLCSSLSGAAGYNEDDILFQQLLHQLYVGGVRTNLGVVAAYHGNCAADNARANTLNQRLGGSNYVNKAVGNGIQSLNNCLEGITYSSLLLDVRNMYQILLTVYKVLNRGLYDQLRILAGILTMSGLYSINLFIMNSSANVSLISAKTLFNGALFRLLGKNGVYTLVPILFCALVLGVLIWFFKTHHGLCIRATGDNEAMVRAS